MSDEAQRPQQVIVTSTKSVAISLILTFLFGPLGMLYSTISGAIIMIILSIVVAIFTVGIGLAITWPISMIWGALAVSSANNKLIAKAVQQA